MAQVAIRKKDERKSKRSATGVLGLGKRKQEEEGSRALEKAEAGVSFSQSEVSTPRPITRKTLLSYNFKQWFGRSTLKDEKTGQPDVFYHGSKTFGIDNTASWAFDDKKLGKKTGSPMASLGHFFAKEKDDAMGYSEGTGNVKAVYIRLENPKIMTSDQLKKYQTTEEFIALRNRLRDLGDHDGIYITDEEHAVIFSANQAKSAESNTGEFSREDDDIRYSIECDSPQIHPILFAINQFKF